MQDRHFSDNIGGRRP